MSKPVLESENAISRDAFRVWLKDPVTVKFMAYLNAERDRLKEGWAQRMWAAEDNDVQIGKVMGLEQAMRATAEDVEESLKREGEEDGATQAA